MGSASKAAAVIVAASVGAVEALKDQAGLCRWNYAFRTLQQHAKADLHSFSQSRSDRLRRFAGASAARASGFEEKLKKRRAEKDEKVYHLVCWGPS